MGLRPRSVDRGIVSARQGRAWRFRPRGQQLEDRTLLAGGTAADALMADPQGPQPIPLVLGASGIFSGNLGVKRALGADGEDFFLLSLTTGNIPQVTGGRIMVQVQSAGETQVILRQGRSGTIFMESDAPAPAEPGTRIDMHVEAQELELDVKGTAGQSYEVSVTFTPSTDPGAAIQGEQPGAYAILTGDFDDDGIPDLVTPAGVDLGIGDGTFQPVQDSALDTCGGNPSAIIGADFNHQGPEDIAIAYAHSVSIFMANGGGRFGASSKFTLDGTPVGLASGDFAGDGRTDLAVVEKNPGQIQIFRNLGGGVFQLTDTEVLARYGIQGEPQSIASGVFGGNPRAAVDLAVAVGEIRPATMGGPVTPGGILIFSGNGDGTFGAPSIIEAGVNPVSVVVADLNNDGIEDLAVADEGDVRSYPNFSDFSGTSALAILQKNVDVSSLSKGNLGGLVIFKGKPDGTFEPISEIQAGFLPNFFVVGDFNGDKKTDLLVLHGLAVATSLFLGNGDGTFQEPIQIVHALPETSAPSEFVSETAVAADFNGDGRDDLAVADNLSSAIPILLGKGDGSFQGQNLIATGLGPISVAVGDFNGDGISDLAVVDALSSDVTILLGQGDGGFRVSQRISTPLFPTSVAVGDLNSDGRQDLVVTDGLKSSVSVFLGSGFGTFVDGGQYAVGLLPISVVVGDFSGDQIPDIAVANAASNSITVLLGTGNGTFDDRDLTVFRPEVGTYPAGDKPVSIAAGDFDSDGRLDLVVADFIVEQHLNLEKRW